MPGRPPFFESAAQVESEDLRRPSHGALERRGARHSNLARARDPISVRVDMRDTEINTTVKDSYRSVPER